MADRQAHAPKSVDQTGSVITDRRQALYDRLDAGEDPTEIANELDSISIQEGTAVQGI